jgi:NAD(P)H-dependent FMN reductase
MKSNILIINFSLRNNSGSGKIANYIKGAYGEKATVLNYIDLNLPMWDEGVWNKDPKWEELLNPIKATLKLCDGLVFVIPEYHGMASPAYNNFNLFLAAGDEVAHKPVLIVTNSNARGGSYPITEVRGLGSKNNKLIFIPEHVIVRNNVEVLNEVLNESNSEDKYIRDRIDYSLTILDQYCIHLKDISTKLPSDPRFKNGM